MTDKQTQVMARNYRKAYMTLLSAANSGVKAVDEYFFGQADDRDEASDEIRPYFYSFIVFSIALIIFMHAIIK